MYYGNIKGNNINDNISIILYFILTMNMNNSTFRNIIEKMIYTVDI